MIRVLLADDQVLVRSGLRMILEPEHDIEIVGEAADGQAAIDAVATFAPDVVLMDVRMPGIDGIEATRQICLLEDAPKIVVLTTFDLDEVVFDALRVGACAFLLKDASAERLVAAIRVAADGGSLFAPSVTRRLIDQFAKIGQQRAPRLDGLTPREIDVLRLLARGRTNAEIAADLVLSEHTVKTHIARILSKLNLRDRTQAVIVAYEAGLIRPGTA